MMGILKKSLSYPLLRLQLRDTISSFASLRGKLTLFEAQISHCRLKAH
jgi:hypothetical protein